MRTTRRTTQRRAIAALAGCAAVVLAATAALLWGVGSDTSIGGPFRLVDAQAQPTTEQAFRGRYMLIYFGYTSCPDVCPTTLQAMAVAMQDLGARAARVQPIFVTVDPKRDTPAVLRDYVDAIAPGIVALTGPDDAVDAMLRRYRVRHAIHPMENYPGEYLVDHSSVIYLMAPDGHFVAPLRADEPGDVMATQVAAYMR
ncbi:SCO family protein [Acidisphaera sp. L21]|uniref:SCO family protein n=1 Tax=Acidisphaera sp. L21 TaxID=1641851 RepID=UPI00131C34F5|nr:SCO family protein [Acidisphaera sp. L21]